MQKFINPHVKMAIGVKAAEELEQPNYDVAEGIACDRCGGDIDDEPAGEPRTCDECLWEDRADRGNDDREYAFGSEEDPARTNND